MTGPEPSPQAITAAALRLKEGHARFGVALRANERRALAREALEAAAPHLAAAERERCAQLAEQQAAAADLMITCPETTVTGTALRAFASLLRQGGEGGTDGS